jgi:hypothetical protein
VSIGAANAQQVSRQIQVLPAETAAPAQQVVQAPAQVEQAPAETNAQADTKAPTPDVKAEPEAKPAVVKKVVRFAHPPVYAPYHGYSSDYRYAPRYNGHCNNSYRGYRGY